MDRSIGLVPKRKRSVGPEPAFRPSAHQPSSPTGLLSPISLSSSAAPGQGLRLPFLQDFGLIAASGDSRSTPTSSQKHPNDGGPNDVDPNDVGHFIWALGPAVSGNAYSSLVPDLTSLPARLSDQDAHLLDFPETPPVTSGGSCELYVAVYRPNNLKLAMRRLRFDFPTEDMLRRFRREADIWSKLSHVNILPFFGTLSIRHRIYVVSPWRRFGDLLAFVQRRIELVKQGRSPFDWSMNFAYRNFNETRTIQEIAEGLAYLHSIGAIHGDMKAKNVLLSDEGCAQICDFGLTKTLAHSVTSTELKGTGSIRWQSPELLHNRPKSPESDVYAFGMTVSEILTGSYPFPNLKEQMAVVFAVMLRNERPEFQPHSFLGVDFNPLWRIAASCWETRPEDRPRIKEVLQRLTPPPTRAVHCITHDILQHIIFICTFSDWDRRWPRRYNVSRKTDLTITISHVCQSWRLAATRSPSLWSDLQFNGSFPFNLQSLQIERSDGTGIAIEIKGVYNIEGINQLIQLLRPHVTRWKSLKLGGHCFDNDSFLLFFYELHHEYAPMLETLHAYSKVRDKVLSDWEWGSHGQPSSQPRSQPFSRGTPRLVDLRIGHCQLYGNAGLFSHLTNLSIALDYCVNGCEDHPLCPQDLLAILTQCAPTIRSVDISLPACRHIEGSNPLPDPISLPHLTELKIYDEYSFGNNTEIFISKIYSQITAPKIQSRILRVSELERLTSPAAFPFPNLTCLTILEYSDELLVDNLQSVFRHIFDQLPQLRELKVSYVKHFDPRILESTCIGLQKFSWRQYSWSQLVLESSVIKDMIELRQLRARERGTTDSLVQVRCWSPNFKPSKEDREWLESHLELFDFSFFI